MASKHAPKKEKKEDFLGAFMDVFTPASEKRVVISIDFGSTHCGVAYSLTHFEEGAKPEILGKVYEGKYSKEPTCALFDKKTKLLITFGFEARNQYAQIVKDKNRKRREEYLYFEGRSIKMRLWDSSLRRDATCETVDGNGELPLMRVVSAILSHLKDEALIMATKGTQIDIPAEDALWVLTVPSIWQEADKQFMRKAAHKAGIIKDVGSHDLILALEPECAVISARTAIKDFAKGQKLLCMDCGGGTVDICAVEIVNVPGDYNPDDVLRLRQLLEPTGGNWGSTFIDKNFLTFLAILLDDPRLEASRFTAPGAVMDVLEEWEAIKVGVKAKEYQKKLGDRTLNVSGILDGLKLVNREHNLEKLVKDYNAKCEAKNPQFAGVKALGPKGDKTNVQLPMELIGTFFRPVMDKILDEVEVLICKPELVDLTYLLLVGGFAESDILRHEVNKLAKKYDIKLIVPKHAAQIVQKGAVEYGLDPAIVSTRRARQTIGVKVTMRLKDLEDPDDDEMQKHRFYDPESDETYVRDIFNAYVTKGQEIETTMVVRRNFLSQNMKSKKVKFDIYATDAENPRFVTDPGCVRLAKIVMEIPPDTSPSLECMMRFASTEITAEIKNMETGKKQTLQLQYDSMGLQQTQQTGSMSTFVRVPIRELGPWGDNDFDDHFLKMSEML